MNNECSFVDWFRNSTPYIHAHRGKIFVIYFGGEALLDPAKLSNLIHDIALLQGLGIRLVLVHGARPQIESRLNERNAEMRIVNGLRITDDSALACVKEAAGIVRVEIEGRLSMGLANSPMAGACIRVSSGNFVTARPLGIHDGVDYCHTGLVRKIDATAIRQQLDNGAIALIPPLGYSPTGEVFNLSAAELASQVASNIGADKLIFLQESDGIRDAKEQTIPHLLPREADEFVKTSVLSEESRQQLEAATEACRNGVKRVHLLCRNDDGALLQELFTRDGVGTLLTTTPFQTTRTATIDDVGGILTLLEPLEQKGLLVKRSRELLETEIAYFTVMERDDTIIGCAALYPYTENQSAELACVAIHEEFRKQGRGDELLSHMEKLASEQGLKSLFVLTTQTAHWFQERGFEEQPPEQLPAQKRRLYNYKRNSKMLAKQLTG